MSILTQYVKLLYVENVLKLLYLTVSVDVIVPWNLLRGPEKYKTSSAIKIKNGQRLNS
jgi:hypothetical protein